MAQPLASWEQKEVSWECKETSGASECDSDSEFEDCDELPKTPAEAGDELFEYLIALLESGSRVSAKLVCCVEFYASMAGAVGRVHELSLSPNSSSGNYQKHIDRVCRIQDSLGSLYDLELPGFKKMTSAGRS